MAHAGTFAWQAERDRTARAILPREVTATPEELSVEVEPPAAPSLADTVEPAAVRVRPEAVVRAATAAGPRAASSSGAVESPPTPVESEGGGSWTFSATGAEPNGALITSAALGSAIRDGVRVTVDESRKKSDARKNVVGGYTAHDIALGLIPGGEFVSLTRDTVRTSDAPSVGHAVLEFQIDGSGNLMSVHVLDVSSDRMAWDLVAAEIAKAARGHITRMPHGAQGVALTLDVTSAMKTASGANATDGALSKILHAIDDPVDAVIDGTVPAQRVVSAHVVDVQVL